MGDNDLHMQNLVAPILNIMKFKRFEQRDRFLFSIPNKKSMKMNMFFYLRKKTFAYLVTAILFTLYVACSVAFHDKFGFGIAALSVIPVLCGSWYFGIRGGIAVAVPSILTNMIVLMRVDHIDKLSLIDPSIILRIFVLLLITVAVGRLGNITRERHRTFLIWKKVKKRAERILIFLNYLMGSQARHSKPTTWSQHSRFWLKRSGDFLKRMIASFPSGTRIENY